MVQYDLYQPRDGIWGWLIEGKKSSPYTPFFAGQDSANEAMLSGANWNNKNLNNAAGTTRLRGYGRLTETPPPFIIKWKQMKEQMIGIAREGHNAVFNTEGKVEGTIEGVLESGIWFYFAMGTCDNATGTNTHTVSVSNNKRLPSWLDYRLLDNPQSAARRAIITTGLQCNKLKISGKTGEPVKFTMDVLGQRTYEKTAPDTNSNYFDCHADNKPIVTDLGQPYMFGDCTIGAAGDFSKLASTTLGDLGRPAFELDEFSMEIDNKLKYEQMIGVNQGDYFCTNRRREDPTVECEMKFRVSDPQVMEYWNSYRDPSDIGTPTDLAIALVKTAGSDDATITLHDIQPKTVEYGGNSEVLELDVVFEPTWAAAQDGLAVVVRDAIDLITIWPPYGSALT